MSGDSDPSATSEPTPGGAVTIHVDDVPAFTRAQFLVWGLAIELVTLAIATGLAFATGQHFWRGIRVDATDIAIACLATLPMLIVFVAAPDLAELVRKLLGPALKDASLLDLFIVSLMAGLCEEALFRGVLEPWIASGHWIAGFVGANLIFGLLHAVTRKYLILATAFGCYLSLLNWAVGEPNLLRPIVCHALYDFLAFAWLRHTVLKVGGTNGGGNS